MKCLVFRCSKKEEMYLYTPYQEDEKTVFENLPDGLMQITGKLVRVMELDLTPERKLARVNSIDVINALNNKGYYLQSPPESIRLSDTSMLNNPSDGF